MNFNEKVFAILATIPAGKVTYYGAIARAIGNPRCSRAVGYALHQAPNAPNPELLFCHRVVFKDGRLTPDYIFGGKTQQELLKAEGVVFLPDGETVDMKASLFLPEEWQE